MAQPTYHPTATTITDARRARRFVSFYQQAAQHPTLTPRADLDVDGNRAAAYGRIQAELAQCQRILDEAGDLTRARPQCRRLLATVTSAIDEMRRDGVDRPRVPCDYLVWWA